MEGLDTRLAAILGIGGDTDDRHTEIKKRIWSLNDVYSFRTNGHDIDVFYLNDEVGSRIYHSGKLQFIFNCTNKCISRSANIQNASAHLYATWGYADAYMA